MTGSADGSLSVVLAGGGTGGHIEPMLALADALRRRDDGRLRITCLGTARGMETRLVPARGYDLRLIPPVPLPRKPTVDLLKVPGRVVRAVSETWASAGACTAQAAAVAAAPWIRRRRSRSTRSVPRSGVLLPYVALSHEERSEDLSRAPVSARGETRRAAGRRPL